MINFIIVIYIYILNRIWSYQGLSYSPQKLTSNTSNILSLEWDARSDRFVRQKKRERKSLIIYIYVYINWFYFLSLI